jgi:hypothetical protein
MTPFILWDSSKALLEGSNRILPALEDWRTENQSIQLPILSLRRQFLAMLAIKLVNQ